VTLGACREIHDACNANMRETKLYGHNSIPFPLSADLPVMVRYLLQASSGDKLSEVIRALRTSISFIASSSADEEAQNGAVRFSQTAGTAGRRGEVEMLTLEAVVSGIKFRKQVCALNP